MNWELNPTVANSIIIYRKATSDSTWPTSPLATVSVSSAVGHYDDSLSLGASYEYRLNFSTQQKFIYAGNAKEAQHFRGVVLLVIDESLVDNDGT